MKRPGTTKGGNDVRQKFKNMSLREYVGEHNLKFLPGSPLADSMNRRKSQDGEKIFNEILNRARKMGPQTHANDPNRSKTAGSMTVSHQSVLRMYPKREPLIYPATHAFAVEALEEGLEKYKQIIKKLMLQILRRLKVGPEFEEICYNI